VYFSLAFRAKCPLVGEELPLFALPIEATDDTVDVTVEDTLAAARRTKSPVKFILSNWSPWSEFSYEQISKFKEFL
jgi:hypothetical protein